MKTIYILMIFVLFTIAGCYEDKGNYDYVEINEIEIENVEYTYNLNQGEEVTFSPILKFSGDSLSDDKLKFIWKEDGGKVLSETKEYTYKADETGNFNIYLEVYYGREDLSYYKEVTIRVASKYKTGWMILSEYNDKSRLCFVQPVTQILNEGKEDEEEVTTYREYTDVYKETNGTELGSKPIMLQEHWLANDYDYDSEIFVMQQGGQGCIELDELYFKQILTTKEEFIGHKYPENFIPIDALYARHSSYILSNDGNLYVRKLEVAENMHSGYFLQIPAYYEGGMYVKDIIPTKYWSAKFFLIYDDLNKRILGVADDYRGENSTDIRPVIYSELPEKATNLNNIDKEYVCCNYLAPGYNRSSYFLVMKDNDEGKYYAQEFTLSDKMQIKDEVIEYEIPGSLISPKSIIKPLPQNEYVFITSGLNNGELYLFDRDTKEVPVKIADFAGKTITSIEFNKEENDRLAIGMESGEFILYDISSKNLREGNIEELYSSKDKFGKIVDIEYKMYSRWD